MNIIKKGNNMSTDHIALSVALFYTEGSSDKEYRVELRRSDSTDHNDQWMTLGFNGRRGGTLSEQKKTPTPVDYDTAKKVYDAVIKEKTKKGYTADTSGSIYQSIPGERKFSGFVPQLLNPLRDVNVLNDLLSDAFVWGQEKHDGQRRPIHLDNGVVTGSNKEGLISGLPKGIVDDVMSLNVNQFLMDGEVLGDRYVAFDLLEINGADLRTMSYEKRLTKLEDLFKDKNFNGLEVVHTARTAQEKKKLFNGLRIHQAEGMVFKNKDALYAPSRPASGGSQMKYKFTEICSVRVASQHKSKRSVSLEGLGDDLKTVINLGSVTIPSNADIPKVGSIINVEYLYRFTNGSLFQTIYRGLRPGNDQHLPDKVSTLKNKIERAYRVDNEEDADNSDEIKSNKEKHKLIKSKKTKIKA